MFKGHPKGLFVLAIANMGERFGYYTMIAIFILFFQARFGLNATDAGRVYGSFIAGIYFLPLLGGFISDKILGYGKTILAGSILMVLGYGMLSFPSSSMVWVYSSLAVICLGVGLFKGNVIVMVGNLYDDPKYSNLRDRAYSIYYQFINIGAFFAPAAADGITNWLLKRNGLVYNNAVPNFAHEYLKNNNFTDVEKFRIIAQEQLHTANVDLSAFAHKYIDALSSSYNAGFFIAALSMLVSLIIFLSFRKYYKMADIRHTDKSVADQGIQLTREQTKQRLYALGLVFMVCIFFWMSFHQNGFTLTLFAKNYTQSTVGYNTYTIFNLGSLLSLIGVIIGLFLLFGKAIKKTNRIIGLVLLIAGFSVLAWFYKGFGIENPILPQIFQQFNPIFVVFLTPIIIALFAFLNKRGKEPSSPKKIGIGMLITAVGFSIMIFASLGLQSVRALNEGVSPMLVTPYWLLGTYLTLTIAELFLSPMGLSFVSKVAPPKYKGLMQGGWLGATAVGNLLAGLIGPFYAKWELWQFFLLLVCTSIISAIFIFSIIKRLENATKC